MNVFSPIIQIFHIAIVNPIIDVLVAIYHLLVWAHVPYPLGFSIIGLTIVIRLILYPLISSQLRASKKMQALTPHLSKLKEKHKGDSKRIQSETMLLYKQHGVNPAAGCLPTLIQLPVIWGLYNVLNQVIKLPPDKLVGYINGIVLSPLKLDHAWETTFFGMSLGKSPSHLMDTMAIVAISIPIITGLLQFLQSKMIFVSPPKTPGKKNNDFSSTFQSQAAYIFPLMIGFFSFTLPAGLSLYWNTFTIFGIIQQYKIGGLGGLEQLWQKAKTLQKK